MHLTMSIAHPYVLPHRWHFFNLGDVLTKKPVTTQDDEDCYKSLVSKNTKSSPLLSRDLRPGQSCSRYRVYWPNQEPFAFAVLRLNISEAGWQRSENLKWKRPALLYKARPVYKKQYSVVTEKKGTRHHMTCVVCMGPAHHERRPFFPTTIKP